MKKFKEVHLASANRLINHGPLVLVSTRDPEGAYDIAPIAWNCPVHKDPPRLLTVIGSRHKTYENISKTGEFIVCVPHESQLDMVKKTGSVSGRDEDKFRLLDIDAFRGGSVDAMVPSECVGFIECRVFKSVSCGLADAVIGDILAAAVNEKAFDQRLLTETDAAKTLHHLGGKVFTVPSYILPGME